MYALSKKPKNYINYGPHILDKRIYSTSCGLFLVDEDAGDHKVIRANLDKYKRDTNFSGLPDLPADV